MISKSRFAGDLARAGLLIEKRNQDNSILNVAVRDPGRYIQKGFRPPPVGSRPLTHMAERALAGKSGVNVTGYREYRGNEGVGAWKWLPG